MNSPRKPRQRPRPLDESRLQELAVAYVGRFATSRAKLRAYLARKIRERGWDGAREPDLEGLAADLASKGYIDDAGYALSKAEALTARGFGKRRVNHALHGAGIEDGDAARAREHAEVNAVAAALRFAERRRIGPFATDGSNDPKVREKAVAAMVRAGHGFDIAKAIVRLAPGAPIDAQELGERLGIAAP